MKIALPTPDSPATARRVLVSLAVLCLSFAGSSLRSEVSVVTDGHGRYLRTVILSEIRGGKKLNWAPIREEKDSRIQLNPAGDRLGDGPPEFKEQPGSRQPWVVWSASDGHDREIAFATWSMGRWQGPTLVERKDNPYDDLNPRLAFDALGRPVVVWWRNEPTPRIYLSAYREGSWTEPRPVTDGTVPGRHPSLRIQDNQAVITFATARGQTVLYQDLSQVQMDGGGPMDGPYPPPGATPDPGHKGTGKTMCVPDCGDTPVQKQKPRADEGGV